MPPPASTTVLPGQVRQQTKSIKCAEEEDVQANKKRECDYISSLTCHYSHFILLRTISYHNHKVCERLNADDAMAHKTNDRLASWLHVKTH